MDSIEELLQAYDEEATNMLETCKQLNPAFSQVHISTSTMYYKVNMNIPLIDPSHFSTSKFIESYPETIKECSLKTNFGNALNLKFTLSTNKSYCILIFKTGLQIKGSKSAVSDYKILKAIFNAYGLDHATITDLYPIMINANFDTYNVLSLDTLANYFTEQKLTFVLNTTRLRVTLVHKTDDVVKKITGIIYPSGKVNLMGANRFDQICAFFAFVTKTLLEKTDAIKGRFVPEPPAPKGRPGRKRKSTKEAENDKLKRLLAISAL
jgi:hypothetical protein